MDFTFLADRIKTHLLELQPDAGPMCVIRGSGGFNDEPGESYIIPYSEVIYLYDRKFSDPDFSVQSIAFTDVSELLLKHEAFSALLSIHTENEIIKLKISSAEIPNTDLLLEHFEKYRKVQAPAAAAVREDEPGDVGETQQISPLFGLLVILMFIATVDDDIADEEQEFISRFCGDDRELYKRAYDYYRSNTFAETIAALQLDEQQKMCCLANILELAMIDGVFDSREQKMIKSFTGALGMSETKIRAVENVLLIKNQTSVL